MNEVQQKILLEQLRDIHLPEPISWWPLAIGWWLLIILSLIVLTLLVYQCIKYIQRNRYRKQAHRKLEQSYEQWSKDQSNSAYIKSANEILRQAVQQISNNSTLVSQSGEQWLTSLATFSKEPLSENTHYALTQACYQANPQVEIKQLHDQLCRWLKSHKRPKHA